MRPKLTVLLILSTFSTLLLAAPSYGQRPSGEQPQPNPQKPACCCQGMKGGMGPMHSPGKMQGRGMMQGMQGHQGQMGEGQGDDLPTAHQLMMQHDKVKRTVKQLTNGVETLTESDDADIAAKIKEHVPAMYKRLKENQPVRQGDPLFRELFRYGNKIKAEVTVTPKGVRVVETSTDPYVVKLIKAHAKSVDELVKRGMEAMHEPHDVPKR